MAGDDLDPPTASLAAGSIGHRLGPLADRLRALQSRLGLRPYRVFLVHGAWSGTRRGFGQFIVACRTEIVPTPQVRDMSAVRQMLRATGRVEEGDIYVDEISTSLSEAVLMGAVLGGSSDPPGVDQELGDFFWEVQEQRPGCPEPITRRFSPVSAPDLRRDQFMWAINLTKRDMDRGDGTNGASEREVG